MILEANNVMCTSVIEPREWAMDDRKGVTYKVEISDGNGSIEMQCASEDVYYKFSAFQRFDVDIDIRQTNYEGRKGVKALIVDAVAC